MKRRILTVSLIVVLAFLIFSITSSVLASDTNKPGKGDDNNPTCFFANGTPITITARTDGKEGATITWKENGVTKTENVDAGFTIFGGSHAKNVETTSITMNGGTVANIFGGGLHNSVVKKTNIVINGGKVTSTVSGGSANLLAGTKCKGDYYTNSNDLKNSTTKVEEANIIINGGSIDVVFGGGESYSYTGNSKIQVNTGNINYIVAAGANGYTKSADVQITGGTVNVFQSVNRGQIESADVEVSGGTVKTLYVGGDSSDTSVNGTISKVEVDILGDAKVEKLEIGTSGGKEIGTDEETSTNTAVSFDYGTVEIVDINKFENITEYVNVIIYNMNKESKTFSLEKGKTLSNLFLDDYKNVEGYKFIGFVKFGPEGQFISESEAINENIEIYALYEEIPNTTAPSTNEKDDTPATGTVDVALIATAISVVTLVGVITVKKCIK